MSHIETIPVLDKGHVHLVRHLAHDLHVVNAAKVSLGKRSEVMGEAEVGLIKYLMKNQHGTPFEHNSFTFNIKCPLFVAREWMRHRIGVSYNEQSSRYMEMACEGYVPALSDIRTQEGKPGHYRFRSAENSVAVDSRACINTVYAVAFEHYRFMLGRGVAKEVARIVLPVGTYTSFEFTCNARSLMAFLQLRMADTAQWEIRVYAQALYQMFELIMPVTCGAFYEQGFIAP